MPKICDNKCVGILVWKDSRLLMIERKKYNFGFAIPAGHLDGDEPLKAAAKELSEEVGLIADELKEKLNLGLPNPCRRENGTHHLWTIAEATQWHGEIKPSADETKTYLWADKNLIGRFAQDLESFAAKNKIPFDHKHLHQIVKETNDNPLWEESPGLEPPMYFLFKRMGLIQNT